MIPAIGSMVLFAVTVAMLLGITVTTVQATPSNIDQSQASTLKQVKSALPILFNFKLYTSIFHKKYSDLIEQLIRVKYFMSRAIRVFISGVKYSRGDQSYFLAINFMSDMTRNELDKMRNKALSSKWAAEKGGSSDSRNDELANLDITLYEAMLKELHLDDKTEEQKDALNTMSKMPSSNKDSQDRENVHEKLKRSRRYKRSPDDVKSTRKTSRKIKRDLPIKKLINLDGTEERLSALADIPTRLESNNPNLKPSGEGETTSLAKQLVKLTFMEIHSRGGRSKRKDKYVSNSAQGGNLPNKVFVDLRDTNCLMLPRNQGLCGSCYAFASTALMEYLYCMKTGELVSFSEQYIIDCGKQYMGDEIFGCSGGRSEFVPQFFHNFGIETAMHYPYMKVETQCPYNSDIDLESFGHFRGDLKKIWRVPVDRFAEVLELSPIIVAVIIDSSFYEYGGGVSSTVCNDAAELHSMLVIGHGREDNEEYWLAKNSFSVGWGEGGYYKFSKKAGCIFLNYGWIFGTSDSKNLDLTIGINEHNTVKFVLNRWLDL